MGRKRNFSDLFVGEFFRFRRYLTNPQDLLQRLKFGPIYARYGQPPKDSK